MGLDAGAGGLGLVAEVLGIGLHEIEHGFGQGLGISCGDDLAGFTGKFADAANVGGDDGFFHGHGFAEDKGQALPGGGEDEGIGSVEESGDVAAEA